MYMTIHIRILRLISTDQQTLRPGKDVGGWEEGGEFSANPGRLLGVYLCLMANPHSQGKRMHSPRARQRRSTWWL